MQHHCEYQAQPNKQNYSIVQNFPMSFTLLSPQLQSIAFTPSNNDAFLEEEEYTYQTQWRSKLLPPLPDPSYAIQLATKIKTYPENLLTLYETCGLDYSLTDDEKELLAYCTVTSDPNWYHN